MMIDIIVRMFLRCYTDHPRDEPSMQERGLLFLKKRNKMPWSVVNCRWRWRDAPVRPKADRGFLVLFCKNELSFPPAFMFARDGNAAVELALLSPLLVILLTGTIALGLGVYQAMQVQAAAEAGALYAANNGTANLAAIEAAVTNATGTPGITASPIPVVYCGCPQTAGIVSQGSNCTTPCAGGAAPGQYIKVSATITRTNLISSSYLNLSLPTAFTGTAVVRTQ